MQLQSDDIHTCCKDQQPCCIQVLSLSTEEREAAEKKAAEAAAAAAAAAAEAAAAQASALPPIQTGTDGPGQQEVRGR